MLEEKNIVNTFHDFRNVQLEGRLAIYESLITEIVKLEAVEQMASEVKLKLEEVVAVWNKQKEK